MNVSTRFIALLSCYLMLEVGPNRGVILVYRRERHKDTETERERKSRERERQGWLESTLTCCRMLTEP